MKSKILIIGIGVLLLQAFPVLAATDSSAWTVGVTVTGTSTGPTSTPPTPPSGGGGGGGGAPYVPPPPPPPVLTSTSSPTTTSSSTQPTSSSTTPVAPSNTLVGPVTVTPSENESTLSWQSSLPSTLSFSWGQTPSYEIGTSISSAYQESFFIDLDSLQPQTLYYYSFTLTDKSGDKTTWTGTFETLPLVALQQAPLPPDNFHALVDSSGITFQWSNPQNNFSYVRLVRSEYGYPTDPLDGKVIYEGAGHYSIDSNPSDNTEYYYSIFATDGKGNYSSPAVLDIYFNSKQYAPPQQTGISSSSTTPYDPLIFDNNPYYSTVYPPSNTSGLLCGSIVQLVNTRNIGDSEKYPLSTGELTLSQQYHALALPASGGNINISTTQPLLLTFDPKQIVEDGDILGICLSAGATDSQKAFIFTPDKSSGLYTVAVPPLSDGRTYSFYIGLVKQDASQEEVLYHGAFVPETAVVSHQTWIVNTEAFLWTILPYIIPLLLILLFLILLRFLVSLFD